MKNLIGILIVGLLISSCSKEKRSEKAAEKMREFVIELSDYTKSQDPNFLVIPQNGIELCFNFEDPADGLSSSYLSAIDGVGIEELYFNAGTVADDGRIEMARQIKATKPVLVADFANPNSQVTSSFNLNDAEGFMAFPRSSTGYDYQLIPDSVHNENSDNIVSLSQAQNYLYLISTSNFATKAAFLSAIAATNFDVVLIDLFYEDTQLTLSEVNSLKTKANGGQRLVIAYMNVGAAESYRYYWQDDWKLHKPRWLKKPYDGYEDEIWVKFWKKDWKEVIYGNDDSYTKRIINSGFDGAYLDNVEVYYFLYFD
ncbi:MAG: cysteinyl-tRNA synthetase [Crocinitomicaceae bacterium]|jgi:cysteinyl-tRNA synthetase